MAYAERTDVPIGRSRDALHALLRKHGAGAIGMVEEPGRISLAFWLANRHIRFVIPVTARSSKKATEQEERSRWRALLLVVRGRLESIETGISTVDEAFLANVVLPDGATVADVTIPQVSAIYAGGRVSGTLQLEP